jgi:L-malate glycosyltransferase
MSAVGDVTRMAENAISLLSNEQKLMHFKQQALQKALQFDLKVIMPRYEALYYQVIDQHRA